MDECASLRRLFAVKPPPTAVDSDTNGPVVSNGHPTADGAQATDHLIGTTSGHFVAHGNGHALGRIHASGSDSPCPVITGTLDERRNISNAEGRRQNAEVPPSHIFYGVSLAGVSYRRRWPPPTTEKNLHRPGNPATVGVVRRPSVRWRHCGL